MIMLVGRWLVAAVGLLFFVGVVGATGGDFRSAAMGFLFSYAWVSFVRYWVLPKKKHAEIFTAIGGNVDMEGPGFTEPGFREPGTRT